LRGNITRKVVPTSCTDSISIVASSSSHNRFTIDKPIPSPASWSGADVSAPRGAKGPCWAVANSLHALENDAESVRAEEQALASANAALRLTRLGYGVGNTGIVQVLAAQRLRQVSELGRIRAIPTGGRSRTSNGSLFQSCARIGRSPTETM
jgi:hypothetical protein